MKKVRRTKVPTFRQLTNMAENLNEKFNRRSNISVAVIVTDRSELFIDHWIHWNGNCESINSWKDLQNRYFNLMED